MRLREKLTVEEKVAIALELIKRERSLDEIREHYRVSHTTAYKLRNQFLEGGRRALEPWRAGTIAYDLEARVRALEERFGARRERVRRGTRERGGRARAHGRGIGDCERTMRTIMYLITGGAGFIGSNLAEALVRDGERVRIFDNFSTGSLDNLAAIRDRVEIVEGDLRDYDAVQRAMQRRDLRLAPGGAALGRALGRRPAEQRRGQRARHAARADGGARSRAVKRVVYASSSSAYGDNPSAAEGRGPDAGADLAVRGVEAGGRALLPRVQPSSTASRPSACATSTSSARSRARSRSTPRWCRSSCAPRCKRRAARGARRRRAVARLHVHRQRRAGESAGAARTPGVGGEVFNVACNERHSLLDIAAHARAASSAASCRATTSRRAAATCATPRRRSTHASASSTTVRPSASRTACAAPSSGSRRSGTA